MSTSISPSNKSNIIIYRKSTNNSNSGRDSGSDSINNSGNDSDNANESYNAKMTRIQDELGKLVNYGTKLVLPSLYIKISTPELRPGTATCFEFT